MTGVRAIWISAVRAAVLLGVVAVCAMRRPGTDPQELSRRASLVVAEPPAGRLYHGIFPGGKDGMCSDITPAQVAEFRRITGRPPTWVYFCNNWYEGRRFPESTAAWIRANGSVPYIRMMLFSSRFIPCPDPIYKLENILRGQFDPDLRQWMRDAKHFGSPLIAEYGVEVNGFWFPWNGLWNRKGDTYEDAVDRFRRAYRHIIQIAREEGAYNIRWVFHADPYDEPLDEWNHFEHYYPGDQWIDWVGLSVYGRQAPSDEYYPSFREQMDRAYARLTRMTTKPVIICEFGTIEDARQADWANAALSDLLGHRWPRVIGFSWWNAAFDNDVVNPKGHSNMRVQDSPALSAIFRERVGANPEVLSFPATSVRYGVF